MIYEQIDLYEYFGIERCQGLSGYLTVFAREEIAELKRKARSAMLVIPGGGYSWISKREGEPVALQFLRNGYSSFVLNYSVNAVYPTPLIEACMAVVYIRENAEKYCVDKDHIAAVGFSAGGHLAAMLANLPKDDVYAVIGDRIKLAELNAVVLSYAVITMGCFTHVGTCKVITGEDKVLREKLSMENNVTGSSVPAFIWHTHDDDRVPVENALLLAQAYRNARVPFALHVFERGCHGLSLCTCETINQWQENTNILPVGKWFDLALDWLQLRGFEIKDVQ